RLLLIGLPMAVGSVVLRIMDVNRGAAGNGPGSAGRYIGGAWRYLIGGVLRRDSPKEALVAGWAFLFASSAIFGLAHAPGWGYWKVVPSMVAGLGFGYLFLRHGVGAAILAHFVNDYALSLAYEGIGGVGLEALISLVFIGLAIAGAGFLDPGRIPREYTPSFTPPPYGYPPVRFQCPFCGWVEARYDSGRFTCTRCGRSA